MKKVDIKNSLSRLNKFSHLFGYWKNSNDLQNLYNLENESDSLLEIEIDLNSLIAGRVSKEVIDSIQATLFLNQKAKGKDTKTEVFKDESLGIIISPVRFQIKQREGNRLKKTYSAIKIPAKISKDGTIQPHNYLTPWIPRNLLDPPIEENSPTIGEQNTYEKQLRKIKFTEISKFSEYLAKSEILLKKVTGFDFNSFQLPDYEKLKSCSFRLRPIEIQNTGISKLFERTTKGLHNPRMLATFSKFPKEKIYYKFTRSFLINSSNNHLGHFTPNFSLSTSQRSTLYKFLNLKQYESLPVDGPPGTGKTTVIQSIISNSFVESALRQDKYPTILAVCGATNQSVKNVIDTLNNLQEEHSIAARWVPNLNSHGLFCAARMREESNENYHLQFHNGKGFYQDLVRQYKLSDLSKNYLANFENNFGKVNSISNAVKILHKKLKENCAIQKNAVHQILDVKLIDIFFGGISKLTQDKYELMLDSLSPLDCKSRYYAFLLATHYWEGRWLLDFNKYSPALNISANYAHLDPEVWRWKSMLTPTLVSTLSMAPKFFDIRGSNEPLLDILIFDEAGQTLPEDGVIISTLAKKVVTVGDTKQLKPHSLIPEALDEIECQKHQLFKTTKTNFVGLSNLGITSSNGSLMQLSKSQFPKRDIYGSGAALNEHRRSISKIVEFCNELSYHGRLLPRRKTPSLSPFNAFTLIESNGKDQHVGGSRKNELEAIKIAEWIEENRNLILRHYSSENLADVLAILTPFTAQSRTLKRRIGRSYPGMIIGTVNSLQGAEKPIVIFSSTYDHSEKVKYMLDNDETLINVAVSRAKDSFIVFGSLESLKRGDNRPSNLLARYCLES